MAKNTKDRCFEIAKNEKFGLSELEAKELVERLRKEQAAVRGKAKGDYTVEFRKIVEDMTAKQLFEVKQKRLARKRQIVINRSMDAQINAGNNKKATIARMLTGSAKLAPKGLRSIGSNQISMAAMRRGRILGVFEKARDRMFMTENLQLSRPTVFGRYWFGKGLFDDPQFGDDLVKELKDGIGTSKNPDAKMMAEKVLAEETEIINELQQYGAPIGFLSDHVTTQIHDSAAIKKMGKQAWIDFIYGLLDKSRTFHSEIRADNEVFLGKVYDNIVQGKRDVTELTSEPGLGRRSLGVKMSQSRQLHFNNAADWLTYNKKLGHKNVVQAVMMGIEHLSDRLELVKVMGVDPDGTFKRIIEINDFNWKDRRSLKTRFNQISGAAFEVESPGIHKFTQGASAIEYLSKLGSAIFSSASDPIYVAFTQHYHGKNFFTAYYNAFLKVGFFRLAQRGKSAEIERFARRMGLGFDGVINSMARQINIAAEPNEFLQGSVNNFFRLNGMSGYTNWFREGSAYLMANDLADATKFNWDKLNKNYKRVLTQYGITEDDWRSIQGLPKEKINGLDLLTPQGVLDEIELGNITGDQAIRSRELAERIQNFLITENEFAVLQPGPNERAFMARYPLGGEEGAKPGSPEGMANRMMWLFRGFGLTMIMRQWPRAYHMGLPAFLHLIPMAGIGYGVMAATDILKGREPKKPDDAADLALIIFASILKSGFGGIAGDYLFNDYRKHTQKITDLTFGPMASTINDVTEFGVELLAAGAGAVGLYDKETDALATGWRAIKSNLPYSNWWLSRTAFDYLINYQIQEILNRGSLQRMERRYKQKNNQDYIPGWAPSEVVAPGGGFR